MTASTTSAARRPPQTGWRHALSTFLQLLIIIPLALFIKSNTIELFKIPTGSMEPTLYGANDMGRGFGDHLLVLRFPYGLSGIVKVPLLNWRIPLPYQRLMFGGMRPPRVGDVVVFENPVNPAIDYIKRCAGAPGDRVSIHNGHLYVNGVVVTNRPATATYVRYTNVGLLSQRLPELRYQIGKAMEYALAGVLATNDVLARELCELTRTPRGRPTPQQLIGALRENAALGEMLLPSARQQLLRIMVQTGCDAIKDHVFVNGQPYRQVEAASARGAPPGDVITTELVVPTNSFFMLGDNSSHSLDSRYWGFAPLDLIKGRAWVVYLPIKRIQRVR